MGNSNKKILNLHSNGVTVELIPLNKLIYLSPKRFFVKDRLDLINLNEKKIKILCYYKSNNSKYIDSIIIDDNIFEYNVSEGVIYLEKLNDELIFKSFKKIDIKNKII